MENGQTLKSLSSGDLEKLELFKKNIRSGFSEDVYKALIDDKKTLKEYMIILRILILKKL
ncbi:hypothetical protein BPLS_P3589 [Bathymodiolus platifrons methanotrophic gill symbiont]|uniref:hypothetical protein n=1 Tax=unclassified Gammaproteobacteria TaxID=33811 RepID=UPI000B417FAA|nr:MULTISPECIES: hypothetical protein [unclassified Gammaproteobacteria]GFO73041.1 hypothetical protein BJAS_P3614 [Bathymodiolus japonicus methanotrophic gill symbiont]GFO76036.1 hypothetical protein BPLS_P3589 [Bathymodiolus platifrons methanotrophic gill symbiont]